jgi:nucleoside 2-deoxyribosyltransferase
MKIYFAHPAFTDTQRTFKARFLDLLRRGLEKKYLGKDLPAPRVVDPFDYAPNVEKMADHKRQFSPAVASLCCRLLRGCFLVIAAADDSDTGVAFELGVAYSMKIPALLVSEAGAAEEANAMLAGTCLASIPNVLQPEKMDMLVDLIYGFSATSEGPRP